MKNLTNDTTFLDISQLYLFKSCSVLYRHDETTKYNLREQSQTPTIGYFNPGAIRVLLLPFCLLSHWATQPGDVSKQVGVSGENCARIKVCNMRRSSMNLDNRGTLSFDDEAPI